MEIFTIGHSNYPVEKLIDMLRYYDINCVVDIRGTPYSKYNVQYNKDTIKNTLVKEGYSDFEKVIKEDDFIDGIKRLQNGCNKGYKIALLGAMQDPIRCHRSILVGRELLNHGFNVKHILDDYSLASQDDIEEHLLDKYFSERNQLSIDNLLGNAMDGKDMINEAYKKANKEIGYRIEHLDDKK